MSGYNYGHASLFWNEIIYALDTLDEIPEERRVISLISPWIRDLSLAPSNLSSDDWADLFDMPGGCSPTSRTCSSPSLKSASLSGVDLGC